MFMLFRSLGLKARILLVVTTLLMVGIWGLAWRTVATMQGDIEKLLAEQMSTSADYVASDIDAKIQLRLRALTQLAQTITPELMADPKRLSTHLRQADPAHSLLEMGFFVLNADGTVIADQFTILRGIGTSFRDRPFFQDAVQSSGAVISDPVLGRLNNRPLVSMAIALRDASGQVLGVLSCSMYPSNPDLFGRMEGTRLGNTGYFIVISPKSRTIVSATDTRRILQNVPAGANPLLDRRIREGYDGPGIATTSLGRETLTVSRRLPSTGWLLIAGIETEEIFAPITSQKQQIYLLALLMTAVMVLVLRAVLARMLVPLVTASTSMRQMVDGKTAFAPLPVHRNDEIGQLIESFNALVLWRTVAEHQMEFLAHHDPLTALPNRLLVEDRFGQAAGFADRNKHHVALLLLDLDRFKSINDTLGHGLGDALLKQIASRLCDCLRDTDTLSRQGGDEFLVLLPALENGDATLPVLDKLMHCLQAPFHVEGHELTTTASIGVALYPQDGTDFSTLLKHADMAMYQAKETGGNSYCFFDQRMNVEIIENLAMRNGLKLAVERQELVIHYQPQIQLATGAVVGVEALIRWQHPRFGLIPPGRFIPVAEDSGLIVPIGAWVLHEACRQAMAWQAAGLPPLIMAVNLSAVQFKRGDLQQTVVDALQSSGLAPHLLELELTESILIQDTEGVLATVRALKNLGLKLSIDDFGTGYSSLSYLKRLAVDKIKIDQSFVRELATDTEDAAIVHAIIQMAHGLNLVTIAEGVEDAVTLENLHRFQCDEVQGYHYARPMPAGEFERFLAQAAATTWLAT
jgi:diguanylate cyclase (GGDEF)-like protein